MPADSAMPDWMQSWLKRWRNVPTSENIQDELPGSPVGDALAKANLPLGPKTEEVYWPLRIQQLRQQPPPTPEQQRWLAAYLPGRLPTTPMRDPAWPNYVQQGSDETGHWRQHPDGQWFFVKGPDYDYSKVPIPREPTSAPMQAAASPFPGALGVSDPADFSYWYGGGL